VTHEEILGDAASRSYDAVVFYDGLKAFTHDPAAQLLLDGLIEEEQQYLLAMSARRRLDP
jgi:hypothetical protein